MVLYCIISLLTAAFWMMYSPSNSGGKRQIDETVKRLKRESRRNSKKLVSSNNVFLYCLIFFLRRKWYILIIYLRKVNVYLKYFSWKTTWNRGEAGKAENQAMQMWAYFLWMNDFSSYTLCARQKIIHSI